MMRGRTVKFVDADNDGDLDLLNFAFPDSEKKGASENYIYQNNGKGELILNSTLPAIKVDGQKTLVADFNNDNISDIILYGNGNAIAYQGNGDLTYKNVTKKIFPFSLDEVTAIAEIDFDNDGDLDLYVTRGLEFEKGETFFDKETQTFGFFTKRGEFQFDDIETGDVLKLDNFQSQWPNNDTYFIGESSYDYEFPGETHSGKDIKLVNSNALGFPDSNNFSEKKGWYIGYVGNEKWRIAGFLWAPSTGIVHGVKNYTESKHPKGLNSFLLENKNGKFVDVTKKANLLFEEHAVATSIADFNNDGFEDILIIKRGDLIHANEAIIYQNKGNSTFQKLESHQIISTELGAIGMAVEVLDYNNDGKIDVVVGNERGKWHLFKNEITSDKKNNYLVVEVGNSLKENTSPLGATVTLKSCSGNQVQRVGATGSQYSQGFNNFMHFGLGDCTKSVKIKITYSNGEVIEKTIDKFNQKVLVGKQ